MKRFNPAGAKIDNKRVLKNVINFNITKTVLFVSKVVKVNGTLESIEDSSGCANNLEGYNIVLNFDGSDAIVTDNIDRLEAKLCVDISKSNQLVGSVKGKIYKGNNYSNAFGTIAKGIIEAQVNPLINALNAEIQSIR